MSGPPPVGSPAGAAAGTKPPVKATAKLSHLKFMQKAAAKAKLAATPKAGEAATDASDAVQSGETERWSAADGQAGRGCRVIVEDAPPPGASLGRLSFGAFNPTIEALQVATEAAPSVQPALASASGADVSVSVSDAAMAATLGGSSREGHDANGAADGPTSGKSRAEAARKEAMASMTRVAVGRGPAGVPHAAAPAGSYGDDGNGLLSLSATVARPERLHQQTKGGKKQGRGLREGEEDIAPLRQPKRKKHGR